MYRSLFKCIGLFHRSLVVCTHTYTLSLTHTAESGTSPIDAAAVKIVAVSIFPRKPWSPRHKIAANEMARTPPPKVGGSGNISDVVGCALSRPLCVWGLGLGS